MEERVNGTECAEERAGEKHMENPKKRAYTKRRLIKELAFRSGISQNRAREALEAIIEIAYREAKANYFVLPGLCKFDVVRRKARHVRNPITGESLVLPERDVLHVALSKRAKEAVAPRVAPMTPEDYAALMETSTVAESAPSVAEAPAESKTETPAESIAEAPAETMAEAAVAPEELVDDTVKMQAEDEADAISFFCSTCEQEIIATKDAAGCEAECPTCGAILTVPSVSEPGSLYAASGDVPEKEIITSDEVENLDPQVLKNRTIRIDATLLADEIAKATGTADTRMDAAMKSRTMRIDLPDEF